MRYSPSVQKLINHFSSLPSVGPKTAERYVFYLLKKNPEELQQFAQDLAELKEKTTKCQICLAYAESNPCAICADKKRRQDLLCVVADTRDMLTIEATGQFNGYYHILDGQLDAIEGIKPEQLNIKQLEEKIKRGGIKEIILALDPTLEGETTAMYLAKMLKPGKIKITRLARGLPTGADLEYADEMTIANALKYRSEM